MEQTRSHWAWGWAERMPDREARGNLAMMIEHMLGFAPTDDASPVPLSSLSLPSPRIAAPSLGVSIAQDDETRARHTWGRAYPDILRGFRGEFDAPPDMVAFPKDADEVQRLLAWASAEGVAVIPYGGGTSVVAGVNSAELAARPVMTLSTRRMNRVLEVDPVSRLAHIQGGALGPEIEDQLRPGGWTLRHFPQSFEFSTLGGWIATRAGGHFATLYTHIDELTASARMVTPQGMYETPRLPATGAGPAPLWMVLGSEGSLGVITDAWMRIRPRPRWRAKADVHFTEYADAVAATRALSQSGLYPTNCRLLDRREAMLNQVSMDGHHVLLIGFESSDHEPRVAIERALEIAQTHGGACAQGARFVDEQDAGSAANAWRQSFFDGPYLQSALVHLGIIADTFETAVTWDRFEALHADVIASVRGAMQEVCGVKGFISCRFTHVYPDGPAPYYTWIAPGRPGAELEQWAVIKRAASDALARHGATITHHHAVGRTHRPWHEQERPAPFTAMWRGARAAVDPAAVMNPGVLIDEEGA